MSQHQVSYRCSDWISSTSRPQRYICQNIYGRTIECVIHYGGNVRSIRVPIEWRMQGEEIAIYSRIRTMFDKALLRMSPWIEPYNQINRTINCLTILLWYT